MKKSMKLNAVEVVKVMCEMCKTYREDGCKECPLLATGCGMRRDKTFDCDIAAEVCAEWQEECKNKPAEIVMTPRIMIYSVKHGVHTLILDEVLKRGLPVSETLHKLLEDLHKKNPTREYFGAWDYVYHVKGWEKKHGR